MLITGFIYALKSALLLSLLYLIYRLVMHQNTRFAFKRVVLLGILCVSLLLPALEVRTSSEQVAQVPVINEIEAVVAKGNTKWVPPTMIQEYSQEEGTQADSSIPWTRFLVYVYWVGVAIALLVFLVQLGRIGYLLAVGQGRHDLDRMLISHGSVKHPFSFWKWTFIPLDLDYDQQTWEIISNHENEHLRLWHSLDLILMNFVRALLWFTPAVYFLQKAMLENHEHQVDQNLVRQYNLKQYTTALLSVSFQSQLLNLGHNFALKSGLSKRISQLTKAPSHWFKSASSACLLLIISGFAFYHTSLYGQEMQTPIVSTISFSKGVAVTNRALVPERFLIAMDRLKAQNPDKEYMFDLTLFFNPSSDEHKSVVYYDPLTEEESKNVPMSTFTTQFRSGDGQVQHEIISPYTGLIKEIDLRVKRKTTGYVHSNRYYNFDDTYHPVEALTTAPAIKGDMAALHRLITLDVLLPETFQKSSLPESFEYEVYFNEEGYPVKFMLTDDSKHGNETLYRLEGQVYRNLREKATFFKWSPGKIENEEVKSIIKLRVPTKLLL